MLRGDVIPLDWLDDNYDRILERLAPAGDPDSNPNTFGQAAYFEDDYDLGEGFLRLKNDNVKPMISHGLTPLAGWFSYARSWYTGCGKPGQCDNVGWKDIRAYYDPNAACSKTYVLMITDGDETCDNNEDSLDYYTSNELDFPDGFQNNSDQCRYRASFESQEDVETLVIGFGVEDKNKLQCAGTPVVYAYNKEELFNAISDFVSKVLEQAAAFASAAVPTVQANIVDKIYLSSFTPLNGAAIWPGRLDTFLKPLPIDPNTGLPNRGLPCDPFDPDQNQSACFAWDAADSQPAYDDEAGYNPQGLLLQAPVEADFVLHTNDELRIGLGDDERRVFFGVPDSTTLLGSRQWFRFPADDGDGDPTTVSDEQLNYENAWELTDNHPNNYATIRDTVEFTLKEKQGEINALDGTVSHVQYVMGDIFHSNPLVLNAPADFDFYTQDLYWNTPLCGDSSVEDTRAARGPSISYSYYSNKNLCRRVMLFVGSDDGQLHAFDAGVFEGDDCKLDLPLAATDPRATNDDTDPSSPGVNGEYNFGSGREIFSFIPEAMMPLTKTLSEITELTTEYGIDGTPRFADVFVDPLLEDGDGDGVRDAECTDREWRTMLFSNYREGGPGFFALDVTQPDIYDAKNVPQPVNGDLDGYVPSCIEDPDLGTLPSGCGDVPFPALRWEFKDLDLTGAPADDDLNGKADLAESWSRPLTARIKVCLSDCGTADEVIEDRFVAIFGGGLSETPTNDSFDIVGNWIYILDIETGKLLYKRGGTNDGIVGSVASDITGVDNDTDGYIDTLYFGTTAGYVYKVALGDDPFVLDADGMFVDPVANQYDPFAIFFTGDTLASPGRPIYLEINAVYVPSRRANALLFGTGDRWNLWEFDSTSGRFYAILDEGWADANHDGMLDEGCGGAADTPLTEACYLAVDPASTDPVDNYLFGSGVGADNNPGWYLTLGVNEKLIVEPFTLSGVTFFTVYRPILTNEVDAVCARSGESLIFTLNTVTTKGYAIQPGSQARNRYLITPTFTTQPYVESSSTKNDPTSAENTADAWTDSLRLINADLRKLLPPGSRFANYTLDIKTIRSDTGIVFIAPVPVAIEPHNWKEF